MSVNNVREDQLPKDAGGAAEVPPLLAASTMVLRGDPFEVLLIRRNERSSFVPGSWVFPGGVVDPSDQQTLEKMSRTEQSTLNLMRITALRELLEESGVWLGPPPAAGRNPAQIRTRLLNGESALVELADSIEQQLPQLVWTARWITPLGVAKRFDTYFFLAEVPISTGATADTREGIGTLWITPTAALERHRLGSLPMIFPTMKNLEAIASHSSADELLHQRSTATIPTTQPVLVIEGDKRIITLPNEEG